MDGGQSTPSPFGRHPPVIPPRSTNPPNPQKPPIRPTQYSQPLTALECAHGSPAAASQPPPRGSPPHAHATSTARARGSSAMTLASLALPSVRPAKHARTHTTAALARAPCCCSMDGSGWGVGGVSFREGFAMAGGPKGVAWGDYSKRSSPSSPVVRAAPARRRGGRNEGETAKPTTSSTHITTSRMQCIQAPPAVQKRSPQIESESIRGAHTHIYARARAYCCRLLSHR